MSNSKYIINGTALSVGHVCLQVLTSFFLMPFIISSLGVDQYGVWLLIAAFVGYYGLLDLGISGAVARFVSRAIGANDRTKEKHYVSSAFYFLCIVGLVIFFLSGLFAFCVQFFVDDYEKSQLFKYAIIILGLSIGISFPLRVFDGVLVANLRVDLKKYIEIGEILIRTISVVIVLKAGFGILGLAIVSSISMLFDYFTKAFFAFRVDLNIKVSPKHFKIESIMEMKDFAIFNFIRSGSEILSNKIDPYTVAIFASISSVAYYGVALSLASYLTQFFRSFTCLLAPVISQKEGAKDMQGINFIFLFMSRSCVIIITFIVMLIIFYGDLFIERWLGPEFSYSYIIVLVLTIPFLASLGLSPSSYILDNTGKHRINSFMDIVMGFSNLILSISLGYHFGVIGVAVGTAIPLFLISGILRSYYACKQIGLSFRKYNIQMGISFLKVLFLVVPVWFVFGKAVESTYASLVSIFVLHGLVFLILGWFVLISKDDSEWLKNIFFSRWCVAAKKIN